MYNIKHKVQNAYKKSIKMTLSLNTIYCSIFIFLIFILYKLCIIYENLTSKLLIEIIEI